MCFLVNSIFSYFNCFMYKNYCVLIIDFVLFNKKINSVIILAEALYLPSNIKIKRLRKTFVTSYYKDK